MREYTIPAISISEYRYRIELHAHTKPASKCSDITPQRMVQVHTALGYDGVVLTNHIRPDYTLAQCMQHAEDYEKAVVYAETQNLKVFFGVEMSFTDVYGDFLVYGIEPSDLPAMHRYCAEGAKAFAVSPEREKSIVFTAHPYRNDRVNSDIYVPWLSDGVESINMHARVNNDNGYMTKTAQREKLLTICGTDYHHETHEGMSAILTKELPQTNTELRDLLRSGDYLFEINGNVIIPSHKMLYEK